MEQEKTKSAVTKSVVLHGVIIGVLLSFVFVLSSMWHANTAFSFLNYAVLIVGIFFGLKSCRDRILGGFISYKKALGTGTLMAFFGAILVGVFAYIYLAFIDHSLIDFTLEEAQKKLMKQGMPDEQIETAMRYTKMFTTPLIMGVLTILGNTFMGFIFSLIISIFIKKETTTSPTIQQNQ